jgi:uncharacterized protein
MRAEGGGRTEWPTGLDVDALLADGWRPTPFREYILKIHSRCNLACTYCYMYTMADQSWRRQPRRMSAATIDAVAARIAEHARSNALTKVNLILHGGEPLLAGAAALRHAVTAVRDAVDAEVLVNASVQTNGTLLNRDFLELFDELGVRVSVSLDGDRKANDRYRTYVGGQSSHRRVLSGLDLLTGPRFRHLFAGLLAAVDIRNDPVETYESLLAFEPPWVDFLLPHATWDTPPSGAKSGEAPYGDWLVRVFDRWYGAPVAETRIRLFTEIIRQALGRPSRTEAVGLSPVAVAVVETDGSIEQVDTLKVAYEGATRTSLHVSRDSFDAALMLPQVAARQIGRRALADKCLSCEVGDICGGGLYPHRYRSASGFRNPSVYCDDLFRLVRHVTGVVGGDMAGLRARLQGSPAPGPSSDRPPVAVARIHGITEGERTT